MNHKIKTTRNNKLPKTKMKWTVAGPKHNQELPILLNKASKKIAMNRNSLKISITKEIRKMPMRQRSSGQKRNGDLKTRFKTNEFDHVYILNYYLSDIIISYEE